MKSGWFDNHHIMICPVCKHTYKDDYRGHTDGEPFIQLETPLLYEKKRDYGPTTVIRITHYACPECGTTQIDLHDI